MIFCVIYKNSRKAYLKKNIYQNVVNQVRKSIKKDIIQNFKSCNFIIIFFNI